MLPKKQAVKIHGLFCVCWFSVGLHGTVNSTENTLFVGTFNASNLFTTLDDDERRHGFDLVRSCQIFTLVYVNGDELDFSFELFCCLKKPRLQYFARASCFRGEFDHRDVVFGNRRLKCHFVNFWQKVIFGRRSGFSTPGDS